MTPETVSAGSSPHRSGGLESPKAGGSQRDPFCEKTPVSSFSVTPRLRGSIRRTPLGFRGSCNRGFKSPVQSPLSGKTGRESEDSLERDISELKQKEAALDKEIAELEAEGYSLAELEEHISLLHQYNELKDAGQMLLGRLAVLRGVTTKDLYAEFGMDLED
ncbi:DNA repair protein SWI5 homolog [Rhinophrynus dorsalis]